MYSMTRTTISLPDELLDRLRQIAAERRTSMAALVPEALEETGSMVNGRRGHPEDAAGLRPQLSFPLRSPTALSS
jgi:predicted transcriptional regulator